MTGADSVTPQKWGKQYVELKKKVADTTYFRTKFPGNSLVPE